MANHPENGPANPYVLQLESDLQNAQSKAQLYKTLLQNTIGLPCNIKFILI